MALGNPCLFYLYQFFNVALILGCVMEIVCSCLILEAFSYALNWHTLCFLVLGSFSLVVSLIGLTTRHDLAKLFFCIAALLVASCAQAGFAFASIFSADYQKEIDGHLANVFRFAMLAVSGVELLVASMAWFYRESLCDDHAGEKTLLVTKSDAVEDKSPRKEIKP